jgi:hypothetical protein
MYIDIPYHLRNSDGRKVYMVSTDFFVGVGDRIQGPAHAGQVFYQSYTLRP